MVAITVRPAACIEPVDNPLVDTNRHFVLYLQSIEKEFESVEFSIHATQTPGSYESGSIQEYCYVSQSKHIWN